MFSRNCPKCGLTYPDSVARPGHCPRCPELMPTPRTGHHGRGRRAGQLMVPELLQAMEAVKLW